jgi:hypothetical protein
MKKLYKIKHFIFITLLVPSISFALNCDTAFSLTSSNFAGIVNEILCIIEILIPILIGLALMFFFWGLSKFILNSDKPEKIKEGKNYMMWGILALFILISFKGIVVFLASELELTVITDTNNVLLTP